MLGGNDSDSGPSFFGSSLDAFDSNINNGNHGNALMGLNRNVGNNAVVGNYSRDNRDGNFQLGEIVNNSSLPGNVSGRREPDIFETHQFQNIFQPQVPQPKRVMSRSAIDSFLGHDSNHFTSSSVQADMSFDDFNSPPNHLSSGLFVDPSASLSFLPPSRGLTQTDSEKLKTNSSAAAGVAGLLSTNSVSNFSLTGQHSGSSMVSLTTDESPRTSRDGFFFGGLGTPDDFQSGLSNNNNNNNINSNSLAGLMGGNGNMFVRPQSTPLYGNTWEPAGFNKDDKFNQSNINSQFQNLSLSGESSSGNFRTKSMDEMSNRHLLLQQHHFMQQQHHMHQQQQQQQHSFRSSNEKAIYRTPSNEQRFGDNDNSFDNHGGNMGYGGYNQRSPRMMTPAPSYGGIQGMSHSGGRVGQGMMMQGGPGLMQLHQNNGQNQFHHTNLSQKQQASSQAPPPGFGAPNETAVEEMVSKTCRDILVEAANRTLKAVELANTLRARVGTEVLAYVREKWGGLLALLERHPYAFRVERIPKNDLVSLINDAPLTINAHSISGHNSHSNSMNNLVGAGINGSSSRLATPSPRLDAALYPISSTPGLLNNVRVASVDTAFSSLLSAPSTSISSAQLQMTMSGALPESILNGDGVFLTSPDQQHQNGEEKSRQVANSSPSPPPLPLPTGQTGQKENQPSRCLHIGTVPANLNENQLLLEFEQFGEVETMKVVTQRNRKFAFVTYKTIEQSILAKQRMSKIQSWKSTISFAHKESYGTSSAPSSNSSTPSPEMQMLHGSVGGHHVNNFETHKLFQLQQQHLVRSASSTPALPEVEKHSSEKGVERTSEKTGSIISPDAEEFVPGSRSAAWFGKSAQNESSKSLDSSKEDFKSKNNSSNIIGNLSSKSLDVQDQRERETSVGSSNSSKNLPRIAAFDILAVSSELETSFTPSTVSNAAEYIPKNQQQSFSNAVENGRSQSTSSLPNDRLFTLDNSQGHQGSTNYGRSASGDSQTSSVEYQAMLHRLRLQQQQLSSYPSPVSSPLHERGRKEFIRDPVLRRLCDDTYVPTQQWPLDLHADAPYCAAVVSQLKQFGGQTTVSKLRGFLRNRLQAPDNIKSVPLKALLGAYPHMFQVSGNHVSLMLSAAGSLSHSHSPHSSHSAHASPRSARQSPKQLGSRAVSAERFLFEEQRLSIRENSAYDGSGACDYEDYELFDSQSQLERESEVSDFPSRSMSMEPPSRSVSSDAPRTISHVANLTHEIQEDYASIFSNPFMQGYNPHSFS